MIGASSHSYSEDETIRGLIIKTDTSGNELWSHSYDYCDSDGTGARMLTLYNQTGYILSCGKDSIYPPELSQMRPTMTYINRYDLEGNRLWDYPVESFRYRKGGRPYAMKDGSIWLAGSNATPIDGGPSLITGWIAKLSAEGELLWERQYSPKNQDVFTHLTDLIETHDGGVALTGLYAYIEDGLTKNDIWLLKLDQDGCIEAGCDEPYLILEDTVVGIENTEALRHGEVVFEVFPNPVQDILQIEVLENVLVANKRKGKEVELLFYNATGQLVERVALKERKMLLKVEDWKKGVYIYHLEGGFGSGKLVVE